MKILSVEFTPQWSWGLIIKDLIKNDAKNEYNRHFFNLNQNIQTKGFDMVFCQNVTLLKKFSERVKTICRMGGNQNFDGLENSKGMEKLLDRMSKCYCLIATNKKLYDIAKSVHDNVHLLPNGIDLEEWGATKHNHKKNLVIGFCGNISNKQYREYKGYDFVKNACDGLNLELKTALYKNNQIPHEEMREKFYDKIDVIVHPTLGEGCIPEGELLFVDGQVISSEDIKIGDNLYGGMVNHIYDNGKTDNWLKIKPQKLPPIRVTSEHPIKIANIKTKYFTGKKRKEIGHAYIKYCDGTEFKEAKDVSNGDYLIFQKYKTYKKRESFVLDDGLSIPLNREIAFFLGWYLAEGSTCGEKLQTSLALGSHEVNEVAELERIVLKYFNRKSYTRTRKFAKCTEIRFRHASLGRWLKENMGLNCYTKKIPKIIMDAGDDIVREFLRAYENGDGYHEKKGSYITSTTSRGLSYQLVLLYSKLDIFASWYEIPAPKGKRYIRGREIFPGIHFIVRAYYENSNKNYVEDEKNFYSQVRNIEKIKLKSKRINFMTNTHEFSVGMVTTHNCSNTLMEACACGVPIITTACAGYHGEQMVDGENVLFCERSTESITECINKLINDKNLYNKLCKGSRKFAEDHHDINVIAKKYNEIFTECHEYNNSKPKEIKISRIICDGKKQQVIYTYDDKFKCDNFSIKMTKADILKAISNKIRG